MVGLKGGERGTCLGTPIFKAPRGVSCVIVLHFGEKLTIHSYNILRSTSQILQVAHSVFQGVPKQNRRQKVFNRWALRLCVGDLTF